MKKEHLITLGALEETYITGEYIFREGETPIFYHQIVDGNIKITNLNDKGEEFIHNIMSRDSPFGESMLLLERPYPVNAVALTNCSILKISRAKLLELMITHPQAALDICMQLSEKAYNKYIMTYKITNKNAVERLIELMNILKETQQNNDKFSYEIPYTRKQKFDPNYNFF